MKLPHVIELLEARIAPAAAVFNLADVDGKNGFQLTGATARNYAGFSVSDAGDVNGDGFDDVIVGTYNAQASYVVFGKSGGFAVDLSLGALNGSNGFKLSGVGAGSSSVRVAVSAAGDVNGDGVDDLIVGAASANTSYVIFGRTTGFAADVNVSTLNGSNGFKLIGANYSDGAGASVGSAGDVNGDGFADVIIGAPNADPNGGDSGATYVVFGKRTGFTATTNLSALNGTNGFKLSGAAARDYAGASVSGGDINGDGLGDVLIGAWGADPVFNEEGLSYVVFGRRTSFAANLNLGMLDGSNGFKLTGVASGDRAGSSVSAADVNGDGWDDVIVGAPLADAGYADNGATYVAFGKAAGFAANLNLSTLNGTNGFKLSGELAGQTGVSVSGAGDFNGDGREDFIIGAFSPFGGTYGASYLVYGKPGGFAANQNLSELNGANGFKLAGETQGDGAGRSVSAAGDVNNDGFDDLIVGAASSDVTFSNAGAAYVIFGSRLGALPEISISDAATAEFKGAKANFTVTLSSPSAETTTVQYATANGTARAPGDYLAKELTTLTFLPGETSKTVSIFVNADSVREPDETFFINLSNPTNAKISDAQGVATIFDKSVFELSSINGFNGFKLSGVAADDRSGSSVSGAGDVNGDGFDDVIVGAPRADASGTDSGASYVVFGKASGFASNLDLSALNGSNGFKVSGSLVGGNAGVSVSGAGDINGDGLSDLIIGADRAGVNVAGASYVVFGSRDAFAPNLNVATLNGSNGFRLSGREFDFLGRSVSGAGDINNDGFDDLIIGAPSGTPNTQPGVSYVVFGKANGFTANVDVSTLDGSNGFKLVGVANADFTGTSVRAAGDVNGDGFADLLVGAPSANPNGNNDSGTTYVVFGKGSGFAATVNLASLDGVAGFKLSGNARYDNSGISVSTAGDFDGDGFDDLIVGAPGSGPNGVKSGAAYLVFGRKDGFAANVDLATLDGTTGFKLSGVALYDQAGSSVDAAGDVNGDGFDDVIIGAAGADPNGSNSGTAYVVYGRADRSVANLNLSTLNGNNGFKLNGVAAFDTNYSISVSGAGDVNGDGFDDLIIGASGADPKGSNSGASYVVFGRGVEIRVSDPLVREGNEGTRNLEFTVQLSEAGIVPITVNASTFEGTALAGSDFTALAGATLTFSPGEMGKTLLVAVAGDTLYESDETLTLVLSGATSGVIRDGLATGTILNDDAPPTISISGGSVIEGDAGTSSMAFTVNLSAASGLPASVQFASADGTARAGEDYTALIPGELTFAPGETSKVITVEVNGDTAIEDHETFRVNLSAASGAKIATGVGTGTILNDDTALRIGSASVREGDSGTTPLAFTVSLEKPSALPVTVSYTTADGTALAGSDFIAPAASAPITFAPGEVTKTINIDVVGDTAIEDHESFSVVLSDASGATITAGAAEGTILNDDTAVRIDDASVREGDSGTAALSFTVNLEKASVLPVTVSYATANGSAQNGSDYVATADGAQVTFAPGETTKTIVVNALGDDAIEDHETFTLLLSGASSATIADGAATGTIFNDDTALRIIAPADEREGDAGLTPFTFTVVLEKPSVLPVTVSYAIGASTATAGTDFVASGDATLLTFAPGETTKTFTVDVIGDTAVEAHEAILAKLSNPANATFMTRTAVATILNDDTSISIADASVLEGHHGTRDLVFNVTLSAPSAVPVSVDFTSVKGTAKAGVDYTAVTPGTVQFAPGETVKSIVVAVRGDTVVEKSETLSIALSGAVNAVIADGTARGTILDDDVTLLGPHRATYVDSDGDIVTIRVSKGTLKVEDFTLVPKGAGARLALVDFSGEVGFADTDLSITARDADDPAAVRSVKVGYINATGIDVGNVLVQGDLGQIDAGNKLDPGPAVLSLNANSIGRVGLGTQLPGGSMQSDIAGRLSTLHLTGDLQNATLSVNGGIGLLSVDGNVAGGAIRSDGRIGTIGIAGDLIDTLISARGRLTAVTDARAVAIGSITIGGSVDDAGILAGYDRRGAAVNGDAGIGAVIVAGNWSASSLIAGARAGVDGMFGTDDDALIASGTGLVAKIASIVIGGSATGTEGAGDHFGFVAEEIGFFKVGGVRFTLAPGPGNDLSGQLVGTSGDLRVREVA